jgi:hypothetical protein
MLPNPINPIRIFASPWMSAHFADQNGWMSFFLAEDAWRRHALSATIHCSRTRWISSLSFLTPVRRCADH